MSTSAHPTGSGTGDTGTSPTGGGMTVAGTACVRARKRSFFTPGNLLLVNFAMSSRHGVVCGVLCKANVVGRIAHEERG